MTTDSAQSIEDAHSTHSVEHKQPPVVMHAGKRAPISSALLPTPRRQLTTISIDDSRQTLVDTPLPSASHDPVPHRELTISSSSAVSHHRDAYGNVVG